VLNRSVNNYNVATFVLEGTSPMHSPERGVLNFNTRGGTVQWVSMP